jgi:hypothetical protein
VTVFLKKLKDVMPPANMKLLLHTHLHGRDPQRSLALVHASALTKEDTPFCPRFYALADVTDTIPADGWISTSEQVTFAIGHGLQDQVVHWFADMGRAVGHWKCLGCNHLHRFINRPMKCHHCGSRNFKPEEVRFVSEKSGASCGIDMLYNAGKPKLRITEIKTMDKDVFKDLKAPLSEHRIRTMLYMRIIDESAGTGPTAWKNRIDTTEADILYVSKGGYGVADPDLKKWGLSEHFSPFKHYTVARNPKAVEPYSHAAKVVKDFRAKTAAMPTGICHTAMEKRAKACAMCKACFSGAFPAGYDWQSKTV